MRGVRSVCMKILCKHVHSIKTKKKQSYERTTRPARPARCFVFAFEHQSVTRIDVDVLLFRRTSRSRPQSITDKMNQPRKINGRDRVRLVIDIFCTYIKKKRGYIQILYHIILSY